MEDAVNVPLWGAHTVMVRADKDQLWMLSLEVACCQANVAQSADQLRSFQLLLMK